MTAAGPTLTGLLLAGGQARRLGGAKATAEVGGRSLLDRAAAVGRACCDELLLLAGERVLSLPGVRRLPDLPGVGGPLGGLAAGLDAAQHDWCLLLSCDQPFVTGALVAWLKRRLSEAEAVAMPRDEAVAPPLAVVFEDSHGLQPFCGLYHRELLPQLLSSLASGERSLRGVLGSCPILAVPLGELPDELAEACLFDVDTPADLARARRVCAS